MIAIKLLAAYVDLCQTLGGNIMHSTAILPYLVITGNTEKNIPWCHLQSIGHASIPAWGVDLFPECSSLYKGSGSEIGPL